MPFSIVHRTTPSEAATGVTRARYRGHGMVSTAVIVDLNKLVVGAGGTTQPKLTYDQRAGGRVDSGWRGVIREELSVRCRSNGRNYRSAVIVHRPNCRLARARYLVCCAPLPFGTERLSELLTHAQAFGLFGRGLSLLSVSWRCRRSGNH